MRIRISWRKGEAFGLLEDTLTSRALAAVLPFEAQANTWGKEVYFQAPMSAELDPNPRQVVPRGTICFWVQGAALALPFGPTPISEGKECRLVTAVNVLGKLEGDPDILASIQDGDLVRVEPTD